MTIHDLGLISALKTLGYNEVSIDDANSKQIDYTFEGDDVALLAKDYYDGKLTISAFDYYQTIRKVKQQLYYLKDKYENTRHLYR